MGFLALFSARRTAKSKFDKFNLAVENIQRKIDGEPPLLSWGQRMKNQFLWLCPIFHPPDFTPSNFYQRMFVKGTRDNAIFRLLRNILVLELFGLLMYFVMATKYVNDPGKAGLVVSLLVHSLLVLMLTFPKLMHYFMLSVYRMMSSKVKTLLVIAIISIAFEVPAMNALTNLHRVAQGVVCVQTDVSQSAAVVDENIAKKGEMGLQVVQGLVVKLARPMNFFKSMLIRLDTKLTRVVEMVRQQWSQLSDLTNKCKTTMRGPYLVCLNKFHEAYIFCMQHERNLGLDLCGAVQRANKICDMAKNVADSVCEFPHNVKNGITEAAVPFFKQSWKKIKDQFKLAHYFKIQAFKDVIRKGKVIKQEIKNLGSLNLRIGESHYSNTGKIRALKENLIRTLEDMVSTYKGVIKWIRRIIHWCLLPVTLLSPFVTTALFVYKFNYRDAYKNAFLTSEFDRIDTDCALKGHNRVMPLDKNEKLVYVKRMRWKMTSKEKRKFLLNLGLAVTAVFWPAVLILLDLVLYVILSAVLDVFDRTTIDFPAHYELKVAGNSSGGELLSTLLETFSPFTDGIKEREQRWRSCFKEPSPPNGDAILGMVALFIIVVILCRLGVWLERQSLVLADYFYSDRVRPRALFLYNTILQNRRHMMTFMHSKQRAILADDQMAGREQLVRRGLQSRGFVRVNCARSSLCHATQLRLADEANVRLCVNCGTFYCISCFCVLQFCLDCERDMQVIDKVQLYYEQLTEDELTEDQEERREEPGEAEQQEQEVTAKEGDFEGGEQEEMSAKEGDFKEGGEERRPKDAAAK